MAAVSFQPAAAGLAARLAPGRAAARARWLSLPLRPTVAAFSSSCEQRRPQQMQLVLYSKPGCCLCDGLKEKLTAALSLGGFQSLSSVQLQVRDITTNPEWERLYQYEIPVLAKLLPDGTESNAGEKISPCLADHLIRSLDNQTFQLQQPRNKERRTHFTAFPCVNNVPSHVEKLSYWLPQQRSSQTNPTSGMKREEVLVARLLHAGIAS